jgi:hypothetical protein
MAFCRTPNGSFWDYDDEYFNRFGYDIHGGSYNKDLEYIPGPTWLTDLGCYPEDEEKYRNIDLNKLEDDLLFDGEQMEGDDFKGDFEDEENTIPDEELAKMYLNDKDILKALENYGLTNGQNNIIKNKKRLKKAKKAKKSEDDEGWETVEEDEDL